MYWLVHNSTMVMKSYSSQRGRPRSFDEEEALVAAMHYFWEHGYDASSIGELLKVMHIKKSSFYATFKNKEELFARAIKLYRKQYIAFLQQIREKKGAKQTLLTLLDNIQQELQDTGKVRGCLVMNSGKECYRRYENLSQKVNAEFNFLCAFFTELISEAKKDGEISNTEDANKIALQYINALNGLVVTIQAGANRAMVNMLAGSIKSILM